VHLCTTIVLVSAHTSAWTNQRPPGAGPQSSGTCYIGDTQTASPCVPDCVSDGYAVRQEPSLLLPIVSYPTGSMRNAPLPILIIDAPRSMDPVVLQTLFLRGFTVTVTDTASNALELLHQAEFQGILIDITSASCDHGGLAEIRQFVRTAPVALMTAAPVESLIREAIAEGSIEPLSARVLSTKIEQLSQPALVVGTHLQPGLIPAIRSKGLLFSCGTTLQFAMNLLIDGWCQIVFLAAAIAGITERDELAIFHQVKAKQLAILASALPHTTSAIISIEKPKKAEDYIALFEQIVGHRTGLGQRPGKQ